MFIRRRLSFALIGLIVATHSAAQAEPRTIPEPVAAPISGDGTGLCMASTVSTNPSGDFSFLSPGSFNLTFNTFIDSRKGQRIEQTVRKKLDFSNNFTTADSQISHGDFLDAESACKKGGCDFFVNDTRTSFGTRMRGFLNVTEELAGRPVHIGIYADDAVSFFIFDRSFNSYNIVFRPPDFGIKAWRITESVIFGKPGLYPIEILYAQYLEHAAIEVSFFAGEFADFARGAIEPPVVQLGSAGFTLFTPSSFFQTISGEPSFPDPNLCLQCDRQFVNRPGNGDCPATGYYCNEAALCAPCDAAEFCGPTCSPCGGDTPFCTDVDGSNQCVGCRTDADCEAGYSCDQATNTCQECVDDDDCERGEYCSDHNCVSCSTSDSCAGNSCNCCPTGANGLPMQCAAIDTDAAAPVCVECLGNADCPSGVCDTALGRCVDKLAQNQRADCCGADCSMCPAEFPFCLPGPLGTACAECRWDTDCQEGAFCLSGQCQPCVRDRHCGLRCESCGGDAPYCLDGQIPERSTCVQCVDDDQCASGSCDLTTHTCQPACSVSCDEGTYCYGDQCVECYADTQCPCNGTCDLDSNTCSGSCNGNVDCPGMDHCAWDDDFESKSCVLGPMPTDVACGTTLATACTIGIGRRPMPPWGMVGLLSIAVLAHLRLRRRARS